MKTVYTLSFVLLVTGLAQIQPVFAAGSGSEHQFIVSNGQGVSSPSFSDGLSGENPAGLVFNQSLKLQGNLGSNQSNLDDLHGSGGLLVGNGMLGAGIEYNNLTGNSVINWGIAGRFGSLSLGVSGHHGTEGGDGHFDVGALWQATSSLRWGFLLPNFTHGIHDLGAGFTYALGSMADFVLDAAYQFDDANLDLKPGLTVRAGNLQLTAAYGFGLIGNGGTILNHDFTGGFGLQVSQNVLLGYEYKGLVEHRLGLTLRLN